MTIKLNKGAGPTMYRNRPGRIGLGGLTEELREQVCQYGRRA